MTFRAALRLFAEADALGWRALLRGTLHQEGLRAALGALVMPINSPTRYPEYDIFFRLIRQAVGDTPSRVLDLGSPKTFSLLLAQRLPVEVTAIDSWPPAIDRARALHGGLAAGSRGSVTLEVADATKPLGDARFDVAFAMSVLEHVEPDPGGDEIALRHITRAVREGGTVLVSVPLDRVARSDLSATPAYGSDSLFFQRVYDAPALERLFGAVHNELVLEGAWTIRWPASGPFRTMWDARHPDRRILFSPSFPLLASQFAEIEGVVATRGDAVLLFRRTSASPRR